jgi:hypothetical protein
MLRIALVLAALSAGAAVAQKAPPADPRDPSVKVPPAGYRSAFEGYRPFAEEKAADWRKANSEVGAAAAKPAAKGQEHRHGAHK